MRNPCIVLSIILLSGCTVNKTIVINSNPQGAAVYVIHDKFNLFGDAIIDRSAGRIGVTPVSYAINPRDEYYIFIYAGDNYRQGALRYGKGYSFSGEKVRDFSAIDDLFTENFGWFGEDKPTYSIIENNSTTEILYKLQPLCNINISYNFIGGNVPNKSPNYAIFLDRSVLSMDHNLRNNGLSKQEASDPYRNWRPNDFQSNGTVYRISFDSENIKLPASIYKIYWELDGYIPYSKIIALHKGVDTDIAMNLIGVDAENLEELIKSDEYDYLGELIRAGRFDPSTICGGERFYIKAARSGKFISDLDSWPNAWEYIKDGRIFFELVKNGHVGIVRELIERRTISQPFAEALVEDHDDSKFPQKTSLFLAFTAGEIEIVKKFIKYNQLDYANLVAAVDDEGKEYTYKDFDIESEMAAELEARPY